jgi:hypothetical protein
MLEFQYLLGSCIAVQWVLSEFQTQFQAGSLKLESFFQVVVFLLLSIVFQIAGKASDLIFLP